MSEISHGRSFVYFPTGDQVSTSGKLWAVSLSFKMITRRASNKPQQQLEFR